MMFIALPTTAAQFVLCLRVSGAVFIHAQPHDLLHPITRFK